MHFTFHVGIASSFLKASSDVEFTANSWDTYIYHTVLVKKKA